MSVRAVSVRRRRMVMAIIAGGTALGVAGLVTLAAWNDNEWVFGGTSPDGGDGVGTSSFNVQQYAWSGPTAPTVAADGDDFGDFETNADGNALMFNVNPSGLTPGDTIYAPVALTTDAGSVAGTLQLQAAVASTVPGKGVVDGADVEAGLAAGALWDALTYSVAVTADPTAAAQCTAGELEDAGTLIVEESGLSTAVPAAPQPLSAASANVQYYCFAITLPDAVENQALQGRVVFPAWRFAATSS